MLLVHVSYHNVSAAASTNLRYLCFYQIAEVLIAPPNPHLFTVLPNSGGSYCIDLPITFVVASLICFRCWEFWSLGGLENLYDLLQISESPNLPVAKAIIKVILIYIPVRSADGRLTTNP